MFSSFGAMSFTGTLIYFDDVKDALRRFRRKIKSTILIYGSVARHGCGNDLDMIIVGTEEEWQKFKKGVLQKPSSRLGALTRYDVVYEILGDAFGVLEYEGIMMVDAYIFPPDWTERLEELQAVFPHEDPLFMQNVAADAKTLDQCAIWAGMSED